MNNQPVYTFAHWTIQEDKLNEVLELLPELAEKSRSEEGNLFYKIHQSVSDTHQLIMWEGYKNEAALDAHRGSEHFKNIVIKKIIPLLQKREVAIGTEILPA